MFFINVMRINILSNMQNIASTLQEHQQGRLLKPQNIKVIQLIIELFGKVLKNHSLIEDLKLNIATDKV